MYWTQHVDIYCERTSAAFWAEPVNALSNAAFVLAAIWGAVEARNRREDAPLVWLLIGMAAVIGAGSFLFHTYANRWSELADTLPIWSFVALYVFVAVHRKAGVRPGRLIAVALAIGAVAIVASFAMGEGGDPGAEVSAPDPLNGSGQYAPAVIALLILAFFMVRRHHPQRGWIIAATVTFALSLGFRTFDRALCDVFAPGTHFVWHLLNGLLIGLLLQMLIRARVNAIEPLDSPPPESISNTR
jgi:hypothetical protein